MIDVPAKLVFAHPKVLATHPDTSLHYRGIATLSLKRVSSIAVSVDSWEKQPNRARVSYENALKVARLYNVVISSIISNSTDWSLEDGYRNVLATIGISLDETLRNIIGQEAEQAVKARIFEWLKGESGISYSTEVNGKSWLLGDGVVVRMEYSSEPDICFEVLLDNGSWHVVSTIEIKGGTDPAGALERLGAVKKSFDQTPVRTKNFLVAGVLTKEMRNQLEKMQVESYFVLHEILHNDRKWVEFTNEIFHHSLRLLDSHQEAIQPDGDSEEN